MTVASLLLPYPLFDLLVTVPPVALNRTQRLIKLATPLILRRQHTAPSFGPTFQEALSLNVSATAVPVIDSGSIEAVLGTFSPLAVAVVNIGRIVIGRAEAHVNVAFMDALACQSGFQVAFH